ncbi:MAG: O-methyltransferase, partial [Bdellovibrionota bacterium]
LAWAEKNLRSGGIIVGDNVFLRGGVYGNNDTPFSAKQIEVLKSFNSKLADPKFYETCLIPTGEGLLVAIKK